MVKLSVIMAVYNGEKHLAAAIESVLNQSHNDFEYFITNDCSTDNTRDIISHYAALDKRIIVVNNTENLRIARSLNNMIEMAAGQVIARMDADDIALPTRFAEQLQVLTERPSTDLVFSRCIYIDHEGNEVCKDWMPGIEQVLEALPNINFIPHPTVMIRKSVFSKFGMYRADVGTLEDAELWNRLHQGKAIFAYINKPLVLYRINPDSVQNFMKNKNMQHYYYHLMNICVQNNQKKKVFQYIGRVNIKYIFLILAKLAVPFKLHFIARKMRGDYNLKGVGSTYNG